MVTSLEERRFIHDVILFFKSSSSIRHSRESCPYKDLSEHLFHSSFSRAFENCNYAGIVLFYSSPKPHIFISFVIGGKNRLGFMVCSGPEKLIKIRKKERIHTALLKNVSRSFQVSAHPIFSQEMFKQMDSHKNWQLLSDKSISFV